jgi:FKBP-type peptidyl-prolyl cis-trans isomerase FkpA
VLAGAALAWAGTSSQQVVTTASGVRLQTLKEGTGPSPTITDIVLIDYEGRLEDGTVFDTTKGKQPAPFPVNGLIPGFTEGLQMMKKGGTYRLWIPSNLAYGERGGGGVIPPNANIEFEVTLIDLAPQSALQGMMPPQQGGM